MLGVNFAGGNGAKTSTDSRTEQRPRAKRNNGGAMVNNVPVTTVWASRGKAAWSGFGPSDDDGSTTAGRAHLKEARSCFAVGVPAARSVKSNSLTEI